MLGRRLLVVTNYPMVYMLEVDNNTFQKIKVQFRKTGAINEENGVSHSIVPDGKGSILVPSSFPNMAMFRSKSTTSPPYWYYH